MNRQKGRKMILIVDACVDRENSRTERLLKKWIEVNIKPEDDVVYRILDEENIKGLDTAGKKQRDELLLAQKYDDPSFADANQFAEADLIVIAAPYWNISFPAVLHNYLEQVTLGGVAYQYSEIGELLGLCKAQKIIYITTAGGYIQEDDHGFGYINALKNMYGIKETELIAAEGLDIFGADVEGILKEAEKKIAAK